MMLEVTKNKEDSYEDTITDLGLALKRNRLCREIEQKNRKMHSTPPEHKVRLQQEILILKNQIRQMELERIEGFV